MKTLKKLIPGQPGTKKLFEEYGDKLFCVRYRYDSEHQRKIKTVEIIIEEGTWETNSHKYLEISSCTFRSIRKKITYGLNNPREKIIFLRLLI